ncbi:MAG TPA: hypothetical protein VGW10_08680, partial [Solirubrobacteraceae bacterium]|nr:hypothetical protein [Solirubrobacteraceae bacterium]
STPPTDPPTGPTDPTPGPTDPSPPSDPPTGPSDPAPGPTDPAPPSDPTSPADADDDDEREASASGEAGDATGGPASEESVRTAPTLVAPLPAPSPSPRTAAPVDPPPAAPPASLPRLGTAKARLGKGRVVTLALECPVAACSGTLRVVDRKGRALATKRYRVAGRAKLRIRLPAAALRRAGKTVYVTAEAGSGAAVIGVLTR